MIRDLMRWDPFAELPLRSELDRLRARAAGLGPGEGPPWAPVCDVVETADAFVITAELPGVKDEDVRIDVADGVLTIGGERRLEQEVDRERYHRIERSYGGFERTFRLPPGVREDDIHASVAYGVLKVTVPKAQVAGARRVPISGG